MQGANHNDPKHAGAGSFNIGLMIRRGLRLQSMAGLALAGVLLMTAGSIAAYSALFGSLAAYLPAVLFALIVAPKFGQDSAEFLRAAVIAEVVKLVVIALICMAVFMWVEPLAAGWFFTGMIVVIFTGYIGLMSLG
jgi:F0F1-type ATP synthase assembly protein I